MRVEHPFEALFDHDSKILILGSFPSVKSREQLFFYGHPQNRFWKVTAVIFNDDVPKTIEEKKVFLHRHHIALWDSIAGCDIEGSSDASIRNVVPNDLSKILNAADIHMIFCNGATSTKIYEKYIYPSTHIHAVALPSTSPANAALSLERLVEKWSIIRNFIECEEGECTHE